MLNKKAKKNTCIEKKSIMQKQDIKKMAYAVASTKKSLLLFLRFNLRPLHNSIPNCNPQPFRRSRRIQLHHTHRLCIDRNTLPRGLNCLPWRKENTSAQEQRRFANPLRAENAPQLIPLHSLEQTDVEYLPDIRKSSDLVGSGPTGEELAILLLQCFLYREEALALDEGAFDLAVVDGGIDRAADVHFYVCAEDGVGTCEYV